MTDKPEMIAPDKEQSVIGNLSDPQDGKVFLPQFMVKREGGLFAIPANIGTSSDFKDAINNIFASGAFFRDLDYDHFVSLLYGDGELKLNAEAKTEIRFAADIVSFKPAR